MSPKKYVFNTFRCIVYLACYSVFSISLVTILIKFNAGVTSTATEIVAQDKLQFPVLTFCPSIAFKNPGYFYKEEDFMANVFTKEDLFGDETLQDFMNQSQFIYKETRSELLGNLMVILFRAVLSKFNKRYLNVEGATSNRIAEMINYFAKFN